MAYDLRSTSYKRDPRPTLAKMRADGPIVSARVPIIGPMTFVTSHAGAEALLKDAATFSSDPMQGRNQRIKGLLRVLPKGVGLLTRSMIQQDGIAHRRLRKLADGPFRRSEVERWTPRIEGIAAGLLDRWAASEDGDIVRHVARDLPLAVICEILGLPDADRPKFSRWMSAFAQSSTALGFLKLLPAMGKMNRYLKRVFEERRREPKGDLISALVHAQVEGDRLSEDDLLAMMMLLFIAGHETTTHLISGGILALVQHPQQAAWLREDAALGPSAVDELLRYVCPVEMTKPRYVMEDTAIEGVPLEKGKAVMVSLAAANFDPAAFDTPDCLDLGRSKNRHVSFGAGPHFCLGAWLAKAEAEIVFRLILARQPELSLAVPAEELRWTGQVGMRALTSLPVRRSGRA